MDTRIAAYAVIIDDDQMLLSHWNEHGRNGWTLPGGGIEGTERPIEAATREVLEETGYVVQVDQLIGVDSMVTPAAQRFNRDTPLYSLRVVYRAHIISGSLQNEVDGSSDEARWWPLSEVTTLKRVSLVDIALEFNAENQAG